MSSLAHFAEIFKTQYCTIIFREFSADDDITFIETSSSFQWGELHFIRRQFDRDLIRLWSFSNLKCGRVVLPPLSARLMSIIFPFIQSEFTINIDLAGFYEVAGHIKGHFPQRIYPQLRIKHVLNTLMPALSIRLISIDRCF